LFSPKAVTAPAQEAIDAAHRVVEMFAPDRPS
jgi:hypothetical protein